jgi:hypothetical protein
MRLSRAKWAELREQQFWRMLYDSGAPVGEV